jgi:hypothetical protein
VSDLSDKYCEGYCAEGGKGQFDDCTGCEIYGLERRCHGYSELLMAVEQKFPDETRHSTALRYITEREHRPAQAETVASES